MNPTVDNESGEPLVYAGAPFVTPVKPPGYYSHSRSELIPLVPAPAKRILEVGCGEGAFAAILRSSRGVPDLEIVGVEACDAAAVVASTRLNRVFRGNFEQLQLGYGSYFDCVVFADVLEHMVDPWAALLKARSYLTSGGNVVASIPNVQHWRVISNLVRGSWEYSSQGIMDSTHLRFFTRQTIYRLFADTGFRVRTIRPYIATRLGKTLNLLTGRRFEPFVTYQYFLLAERAT